MTPREWWELMRSGAGLAELTDVPAWRERLVNAIIAILAVGGPIGLATSLPSLARSGNWVVVTLDLVLIAWILWVFLRRVGRYRLRARLLITFMFVMVTSYFVTMGPVHARPGWLVAFAVICGLLFGPAAAVRAVVAQALMLTAVYLLMPADDPVWRSEFEAPLSRWVMFVVNISLLSLCSSLPVSLLIGGLEKMLLRMKAESAELERARHELEGEIKERRALEKELELRVETQTRELRQTNRELEAFAYSISHDLRAPLRSVSGFAQVLEEDCGDALSDEGHEYISRMKRAAGRMSTMIDELLELSRVGGRSLERHEVDLSRLAGEVAEELRSGEPARVGEFRIEEGLVVSGDPMLLRLVLQNLFANALKFTRTQARYSIELSSRPEAGRTVYSVSDNGAGFDPEQADQLFRPFGRLHREDQFEGTGIGLATVQRIIHRHGGSVWARSSPGRGATFSFDLGQRGPV